MVVGHVAVLRATSHIAALVLNGCKEMMPLTLVLIQCLLTSVIPALWYSHCC